MEVDETAARPLRIQRPLDFGGAPAQHSPQTPHAFLAPGPGGRGERVSSSVVSRAVRAARGGRLQPKWPVPHEARLGAGGGGAVGARLGLGLGRGRGLGLGPGQGSPRSLWPATPTPSDDCHALGDGQDFDEDFDELGLQPIDCMDADVTIEPGGGPRPGNPVALALMRDSSEGDFDGRAPPSVPVHVPLAAAVPAVPLPRRSSVKRLVDTTLQEPTSPLPASCTASASSSPCWFSPKKPKTDSSVSSSSSSSSSSSTFYLEGQSPPQSPSPRMLSREPSSSSRFSFDSTSASPFSSGTAYDDMEVQGYAAMQPRTRVSSLASVSSGDYALGLNSSQLAAPGLRSQVRAGDVSPLREVLRKVALVTPSPPDARAQPPPAGSPPPQLRDSDML